MKRKKNVEIIPIMLSLYVAVFILLSMIFAMLSFNNMRVKRLAYDCLSDKANLYIELLDKEIGNISQELKIMRIREADLLMEMPEAATPQDTKYYELWTRLENYNSTKAAVYNYKYTFYEYVYEADLLLLGGAVYFDTSAKPEYVAQLTQGIRNNCMEDWTGMVWDFFTAEEHDYLYACFQQEGRAVGCIISLDDFVKDVQITNLGYEGFFLFEGDGEFFVDTKVRNREDVKEVLPEMQREPRKETDQFVWYTYEIRNIGNVKIVIALTEGVLESIVGVQTLSLTAFVLLFLVALLILWYLYNRILWPMKKFVDQLRDPEEEIWLNERADSGPLEFVYASEQFKKMYREIQSLRIDVYEKELAEKKTMLEYAQTQIRPHFFLNCMSVVQSMAELHHEEDIVYILDVLSDYMKYVLRDTFEMRYIRDEIEHVRNYMDIQKLCKPDMFTFEAIVEENVENYKILPLIIQTFAENAVKHGLAAGRCIEITIYITSMELEGEEFLYITISDTGNGFPQEILELIEADKPIVYDGCEHIGIRNTLKRIQMTYGEKAEIKLSNMKREHGAVVEITLPMKKEYEEDE